MNSESSLEIFKVRFYEANEGEFHKDPFLQFHIMLGKLLL